VQPIRPPSTEQRAVVNQAAEIQRMQEEIARRRRRKLALLAARMFIFVFLPTFLAGWYYYTIATPLYATRSAFVIQQAGTSGGGALGGLFSGTAMAKSEDSINVQDYLQSREAMLRLEEDVGFRSHFQAAEIDPLQRLAPDATFEKAYKIYKKFVKIAYDPTEGLIRMEVVAADPVVASAWSEQLISYAEEQVDHLTQRMREDQMKDALSSYEDAQKALMTSQRHLIEMQEKFKVLSSEAEVGMLTAQIATLESQLTLDRLSLAQMEANEAPNQARMDPLKRRIATLEGEIAALRGRMTEGSAGQESLATMQGELLMAQADMQTRQLILAQTLQSMEVARTEANRQVRYLSVSVNPTVTDEPAYPRAFENTLVAMLILLGIYLMVSMTAAILREQVSA
jgi:capsular polysaccharide transport system permease protein